MNLRMIPFLLFIYLIITVIIEVIIAIIVGIRNEKDILNIILVNVITNPIVTSIPLYINIYYGLQFRNVVLIILELATLFIEGLVYKKYFRYKKINPFIISLLLNLSSFLIGELINCFI